MSDDPRWFKVLVGFAFTCLAIGLVLWLVAFVMVLAGAQP